MKSIIVTEQKEEKARGTALHLELWRSLNTPWEPPFPYKADEKEIEYARQAIYDVMESFEATVLKMAEYKRPQEPHWSQGRQEAFEQVLEQIRTVKTKAQLSNE